MKASGLKGHLTLSAVLAAGLISVSPISLCQAGDIFGEAFGSSSTAVFKGMSGNRLKQIVTDRKIFLKTPMGTRLPISYASNGTMTGEGGSIAKYLSSKKYVTNDSGVWWISRDRLCQKWQNWLKGKSTCIKARKVGRTVHWQADNGDTGVAYLGPKIKPAVASFTTEAALN